MSTYKRSSGNIVFETTTANKSVSFIGPTANAVSVVINGDLSVSGNASLTGNIAGDKIFNGTSSIEIPVANGNANITIGGTSNILVASTTGVAITGAANISGNASIVGNLTVGGVISGSSTFGNLDTTGNITITRDASVGQPTFRFTDTDTTLSVSTVLGAVEWYTNDATPGARVTTAVRSIATSATGNARYEILTSTDGAAATAKFVIDDVGNTGIANTAPLHTFAVSGTTYVSGTTTLIGNVTGGNFITTGQVSATGNLTSAANIAGGNLAVTSNATANNFSASTGITAGVGGISATGNVTGGNIISQGIISATGNLTTTDVFATTLSASGNITGANLNLGGIANTNSVTATTTISAAGNVTAGNINTAGLVSATGNVRGGNLVSTTLITAAGNIVTGGYFVGDGGYLSNVTAVSNLAVSQLANGATNLTVRSATGPITADVNGVANVMILDSSSLTITGTTTATGNIVGGNINTAGLVSVTGNIDGGNVNATIGNFNTVIGAANASNLTTGTVPSDRLTGIYAINISGYSATVSAAAQPNITSVGNMSSLSVVGNTTSGNLITGGLISATGNINSGNINTAGLVSASGNLVSGANVVASGYATVTGNITGGNINTAGLVSATGNLVTGANIIASGYATVTGNITGGNLITSGLITATGGLTAAAIVGTTISGSGNVTGSNVNTGGLVSATGNITGGNINTAGLVSATGNVSGAYLLGNITFASGYNASKIFNGTSEANIGVANGNANISVNGTSNVLVVANTGAYVTGLVSASGNVSGANVNSTGVVRVTHAVGAQGEIQLSDGTGSSFIVEVGTSGATWAGAGSLNLITSSSPGANIGVFVAQTERGRFTTSGLVVSGVMTASGNVTGSNINTGGLVSATGNLIAAGIALGAGNIVGGNITATHYGSGAGLSSINGANVSQVANATYATSAGSATTATTAGTITANAQPNITSVGVLTSLSVTGNITGGNLTVSTGTVTAGNIVNSNANGVGNIGSSTTYFNTVFAKATSAQYADLAEKFLADQPYQPGTVLVFGGELEVTESTSYADHRVAGVVSTDPSYLMNAGLDGQYAVELALQGRVPCAVEGPVEKGDLLVSAPNGRARATKSAQAGTIIGKSLENFAGDYGTIEIVVGRD